MISYGIRLNQAPVPLLDPETLAAAKLASRSLSAYADRIRPVGSDLDRKILAGVEEGAYTPEAVSFFESQNRIRFPDVDPSAAPGQFPVEMGSSERFSFETERDRIVRAIARVKGVNEGLAAGDLLRRNAFPTVNPESFDQPTLTEIATRIDNLVKIFEADVLGRKPLELGGWFVAGGLVLGLGLLTALVWPRQKGKR